MKTRVIVGAGLLAMLVTGLVLGGYFLLGIITLFSLAAVYEVSRISSAKGGNPNLIPAYAFAATYAFVYYYFGFLPTVCLYLICILTTVVMAVLDERGTAGDAVFSLFLYVYPLAFLACTLLVYFAFPRRIGLTAAVLAYAAPEMSDMFAYFGGTLFGKKKLCPSISPKKTVEGAYCAVLGGVACGALLIPLQTLWGGTTGAFVLVFTGFLAGVFSQIGDLFASRLKRWAEIKDFSTVLPGHGGIMDRIDSILMCAPIVLMIFTILREFGIY